jgi:hypothetical protein
MKLIDVVETPNTSDKKYVATFCKCNGPTKCAPNERKKIAFGSKGSTTRISGATDIQQKNYIKRHSVNENWDAINPGSLSRYILWSAKTLSGGIANFKKKFHC